MNAKDAAPPELAVGDRAPNFFLADHRDIIISLYDKVKGGPIVILLYPSTAQTASLEQLGALGQTVSILSARGAHTFTVGREPVGNLLRMRNEHGLDGVFTVADPDGKTTDKYGLGDRPLLFVLDPNQHVLARFESGEKPLAELAVQRIAAMPAKQTHHPGVHAPVLLVSNVFSADECRYLIAQFWARGNHESGTYRVEDGVMVHAPNHDAKRRLDHHVGDGDLLDMIGGRIGRRIIPEIRRAFHAQMTRVEEFKIVCYQPDPGGYFRVHRDNSSPQTSHRRFAMTLNLNADEYEGGELRFPEYGGATYKPTTGEAVVFSCNFLHEATDVIGGNRFVLLSFFYDDAGQSQRAAYEGAMRRGQRRVGV